MVLIGCILVEILLFLLWRSLCRCKSLLTLAAVLLGQIAQPEITGRRGLS